MKEILNSSQKIDAGQEKEKTPEKGRNVKIILKLIRHGERSQTGDLTDIGRKITRGKAREKMLENDNFDAVKAIGSTAGPKGSTGKQRSLETADIYMKETPRDSDFKTRGRGILSYETVISKRPYDHLAIYNANLPLNYKELSDEDKIKANKKAQTAVVNHLFSLNSLEARTYKKEIAGSFASIIQHYGEMAKRLKNGSKVLTPAGTHGGNMELILEQALVRENKDGQEIAGLKDLGEIGGDIDPSEAFNVIIETDENGELKPLRVTFDNSNRPAADEMYLEPEKVKELADFYDRLHKKSEQPEA